jgi:hypothetical protein
MARSRAIVLLAAGLFASLGVAPVARAAVPYATGDVLAGVGSGQIKHFSPTGTLRNTLNNGQGNNEDTGMCFDDAGNLYATNFGGQSLSKFDNAGNLLVGSFGSGFNADPESCSFNSSNQLYVGQADGSSDVLKFSSSGALLATYDPATESRGTDWVDLAADQCTLFYTSEGSSIKRFNVCTNTQLPDFASGLAAPCFALRIRPNGEVLVACFTQVYRLSSTGAVLNTYAVGSGGLFALNLDPDGTSFWTGDLFAGDIFRVSIATGSVITTFNANVNVSLAGLAVAGEITVGNPSGRISARGTLKDTTNGSVQLSAANDCTAAQSTRGFHVSWAGGTETFTKTSVTSSTCSNDSSLPASPAGFNKQVGEASGKLQDGSNATISWTFKDGGSGGVAADKIQFTIKNAGGTTIETVDEQSAAPLSGTPGGVWTFAG